MNHTSLKITLGIIAIFAGYILYNTYSRANSPQYVPDKSVSENKQYEKVVFAGGCFWCTESQFYHLPGVISAVSGFASSNVPNPSYLDVSAEKIKAREAVEVYYDPTKITFDVLLEKYWRHIDPTDTGGQFTDRGYQYTTAIYYTTDAQKVTAETLKKKIDDSKKFPKKIATLVLPYDTFYPAEEYHQHYKDKNPVRYAAYSEGSGRNSYIRTTWADSSPYVKEIFTNKIENLQKTMNATSQWKIFTEEVKIERLKTLTPLQYKVTQKSGTESPHTNDTHTPKDKGIYVDIVSGEPLFLSNDKYDSGTGWPSFVKPLNDSVITLHTDKGIFSTRTEVRSKIADSHLGHVFDDGPSDRGGKRYCMNGASLRFIPIAQMESEGYGEYSKLIP